MIRFGSCSSDRKSAMQDCDEPDQESVPARLVSGLEENVTEMRAQEEMISRADNDERLKVSVIVCFGCICLPWFDFAYLYS